MVATFYFIIIKKLKVSTSNLDCVHAMPTQFENGEKCDG